MATPSNAPHKLAQRRAKLAVKRVNVLWVSCRVEETGFLDGRGVFTKTPVQGTYIRAIHGKIGSA